VDITKTESKTDYYNGCVRAALLALKIYSARYVHYRFSALIASARTQTM